MIHVHVAAEIWNDVLAAAQWYEAQSPGLAADLVERIDEALEAIAENPFLHSLMKPPVRMARVKRFPFGIFFVAEADHVRVIAILDLRRSQTHWRKKSPRKKK